MHAKSIDSSKNKLNKVWKDLPIIIIIIIIIILIIIKIIKIWRRIDLLFKNRHKELDEFWLEHLEVSKIYTLMGCFWPKYKTCELKIYRGVIFHETLESDAKVEEILTSGLANDIRNLPNFHQSTWKSQNWDFDGILLSKAENVWA